LAPHWPKWQHFAAMFRRFYQGSRGIRFDDERPYTLFEMPELGLVVAGLNSTMAESHLDADHHGSVSDGQLRWFAGRLGELEGDWLRLGVGHHGGMEGVDGLPLDVVLHGGSSGGGRYEVLRIEADGARRWARRFVPDRQAWEDDGDTPALLPL